MWERRSCIRRLEVGLEGWRRGGGGDGRIGGGIGGIYDSIGFIC